MPPLIQVHPGHDGGTPFLHLGDRPSRVVPHGGEHPVARHILVGAADPSDVVSRGPGPGEVLDLSPSRVDQVLKRAFRRARSLTLRREPWRRAPRAGGRNPARVPCP